MTVSVTADLLAAPVVCATAGEPAVVPLEWETQLSEAGSEDGRGPARDGPATEALPGLLPRHLGNGGGFDAGGVADRVPPGVTLAGLTADVCESGLSRLGDDELAGVMLAWRRLVSWATAGELAAVAELNRRRTAQVAAGADPHLAEHVGDELAAALTLTTRSADRLLDFACRLHQLPRTRAALAAGDIDRPKALLIVEELGCLDGPHATVVEAAVIGRARQQTTGQLRATLKRAVLAADPAAATKRRDAARKQARVEVWHEQAGTASLAGRDLPPAEVLAADQRIDAHARQLKADGAEGTLDQLRARVYTAFLLGQPVATLLPFTTAPATGEPGKHEPGKHEPGKHEAGMGEPRSRLADQVLGRPGSGLGLAPGTGVVPAWLSGPGRGTGPAGSVNLTMPLVTWLGAGEAPGAVDGFGPLPACDARGLAEMLASKPRSAWCLTFIDPAGRAIAHGCASARHLSGTGTGTDARPPTDGDWALTVTIRPIAAVDCAHLRESAGYQPSPQLRHLVSIRHRHCGFPGCRQPATRCDLDHTIPYDHGGRTCECDLAPLCRRHHRAKQAAGWRLEQTEPGVLVWHLPHGRSYTVRPEAYPV